MSLSYWEIESWLSDVDYCVVGSGITGLTCALELRALHPGARILVLERGTLPSGASTRITSSGSRLSRSELDGDDRGL